MRPRERQSTIADFIRQKGRVSVNELAATFQSSPETIRRDLGVLSDAGKIRKIHGGATQPAICGEGPFQQRMGENVAAKRAIARNAARLLSPGDTLFVDTGSTTLAFAEELVEIDDLTVITNSAEIAKVIGNGNRTATVFLVGGNYNSDNHETVGAMAIEQIRAFRAHLAVLTVGGLDADAGAMDYSADEAQLARAMIERSGKVIMLADSTKFGRIATFSLGPLENFDCLVCEEQPSQSLMDALYRENVEIVC
ncbi:DeoR/GlpR family DNA-binding transcription regulator [Pseudomonadota bacterium]